MLKLLAICLVVVAVSCESDTLEDVSRYDNYQVYRVVPTTENAVEVLKSLENNYDFWTDVRGVLKGVDILVAPHQRAEFFETLKKHHMYYEIFIKNVQEHLDEERATFDTLANSRATEFDLDQYHRLDDIYAYLGQLAQKYPQVKVIQGGSSYEGRNITGVHVSFKSGNRAYFIEAGIHAREWIAPATALYVLNQLLVSTDKDVRYIAENYDWFIFPSVNPDGYEYTHTKSRLWRKTRKPYGRCSGADPNRNWDAHWGTVGVSHSECSETYAGTEAFSEIETKSLSEYITSVSDKLLGYIGFHSYSQLLLIPYGHTSEHLENFDDVYEISKKAVASIKAVHGKSYTPGNIVEVIYEASGGSMDWVKQEFKTPITITYELRDKGLYGFLLPAKQIKPTGEEILASLVTVVKEAENLGYK